MEAAARGLEPRKVPKGSFESQKKSLLPRRQLRSLQEKLSGPAWRVLRRCSSGSCSEGFGAFEGVKGKGQFRKPTKKLAGPARRQ